VDRGDAQLSEGVDELRIRALGVADDDGHGGSSQLSGFLVIVGRWPGKGRKA
jgi:hypothetical protein